MKRTLISLLVVGLVGSLALGLTTAYFSDTETSQDNILQAGAIDLKVDNHSYYNGALNSGTTWTSDDLPGHLFFNFTDLKPGDWGEDTISLTVETNDAWACMETEITADDDMDCTDPELVDDDSCVPDNPNNFDGELGGLVQFIFWVDDGDNVLEANEATGSSILAQGTASQVLDTFQLSLADAYGNIFIPEGGPIAGNTTYYLGKAWCFGDMVLAPVDQDGLGFVDSQGANGPDIRGPGFTCDGSSLDNASQTDQLTGDISFTAYQTRHNENFTCSGDEPEDLCPNIDGIQTEVPDGFHIDANGDCVEDVACIDNADVMLVLDRSGSISTTELNQLKTAALDFVTALDPQPLGAHVGQSSFATTGSLDSHLTDNPAVINAAINALSRGGYTNLFEGLSLASTELANPGDGHDRPDNTSPDYYVVITDGNPNRPPDEANARAVAAAEASSIASGGGTIYVVGVGNDVDATYLQNEIASDPGNYYSVTDYSQLETALSDIVSACNNN